MRTNKKHVSGFTLVELMITVTIVAILAGIALPSYTQYVIRSKRSAAQSAMMDIANREQQFLLANRRYAAKADLESNGYSLPAEVSESYSWNVEAPPPLGSGPPTFLITLTPRPGTGQASDPVLTLNDRGVKTPAEKWRR